MLSSSEASDFNAPHVQNYTGNVIELTVRIDKGDSLWPSMWKN